MSQIQPPDESMKFTLLNSVSDDQLMEELFGRYDHCMFTGMKVGHGGSNRVLTRRLWRGNSATVSGLATQVATTVNLAHFDEEFPDREDRNEP